MNTVGEDVAVRMLTDFLDLLYPAALGEGAWGPVLPALVALGSGGGAQRRALFTVALRHVQRALTVSQRLGSPASRTAVPPNVAGPLPCGLLLLDVRGGVLFASGRAQQLLGRRPGALLQHGRLCSLRGLEDRTLTRALARVLTCVPDAGGALCVDLPPVGKLTGVRLLLLRAAADGATESAAVLALAFEHTLAAAPGCGLLRDLYGFSPAEAELAGLLLAGRTLSEAAQSRSVSLNTARSQLRGVLRKTGARNQADLMRTLIAGPAGLLQGLARMAAPA